MPKKLGRRAQKKATKQRKREGQNAPRAPAEAQKQQAEKEAAAAAVAVAAAAAAAEARRGEEEAFSKVDWKRLDGLTSGRKVNVSTAFRPAFSKGGSGYDDDGGGGPAERLCSGAIRASRPGNRRTFASLAGPRSAIPYL